MSLAVIGAKLWSYFPFLLLSISIAIGVPAAYRYYRQVREDDDPIRDADLLADLEQGDAASLMTEAEFRRVRALLNRSETPRDAKARAKPGRPKPERAAATHSQEEPSPSEHPESRAEDRENRTESEGEDDPSGSGR